jgi:hypothetical protein
MCRKLIVIRGWVGHILFLEFLCILTFMVCIGYPACSSTLGLLILMNVLLSIRVVLGIGRAYVLGGFLKFK